MKSSIGLRIALLLATSFVTFKLTIALNGHHIPGEPFYGYEFRQWVQWLFLPIDAAMLAACVILQAVVLLPISRRLNLVAIALWGGVIGPYDACVIYPFSFNLTGYIERLPDYLWPSGPFGVALAAVVLLIPVPGVLACFVWYITRILMARKQAMMS